MKCCNDFEKDFNGFVKVASCVPPVHVGNAAKNADEILNMISSADADVLVFPELSVTGCTCGDLFLQSYLLREAKKALARIAESTEGLEKIVVIGVPLACDGKLFDCAVVILGGEILGVVPKSYVKASEKRWFASAAERLSDEIAIGDVYVPFGDRLLFKDEDRNICLGVEVGDDLQAVVSPSAYHTMSGANIIVNTASSCALVTAGKARERVISAQSTKCGCAYVYASAAPSESTSDMVMSGEAIICEGGAVLCSSALKEGVFTAVVDVEKIDNRKLRGENFADGEIMMSADYSVVTFELDIKKRLPEKVNAYPFIPADSAARFERCKEILEIQSEALAQRLKKTGIKKAVLGISGGLDSTLALIVTYEAFKKAGLPFENILTVTMPGFGTSSRTLGNSLALMKKLGTTSRTVDIKAACLQHFKDIEHDPAVLDVTYENTQARERTQILMDIANKVGALVVGTGDMSELALGWCTYNGDHMSMYGVNGSVPKTLVRFIVDAYGELNDNVRAVLKDICDTPISPELLPTDSDGNIAQKTEVAIGKYDIHDFILYNYVRNGYAREKITELAKIAFAKSVTCEEIENTVATFYKRFYSQQFKRNCQPDGPMVGSVCLGPRGAWIMPADAEL